MTVTTEASQLKTESSDVSTSVDTSRLIALAILPIGAGNSSTLGVLLKSSFTQAEVDLMTKQNPARFLGLK